MATANGETVLRVDDLRISFGTYAGEVQAVRGATFDLRRGETLAIVGESGSGKSVAARSIMRLNPESNTVVRGGEIVFEGEDLLKLSEKHMLDIRGPKIAMVFQDPMTSLDPTMRVGRQIMESLKQHLGMSGRQAAERAVELLKLVGIPILIVAILTMLIFNPGILSLTIAIGLTGWTSSARLIRGQVLRLKEQEFFLASRSLGANTFRLISKHLIPNVFYILIITLMYTVPTAVFFEAILSFIGLGIQPPNASLGALINDGAHQMRFYPYLLIYPAIVLCLITVCFRLLGDGLRDALDPRMRK